MTSALYPSLREQRVLITGGATGIGATLLRIRDYMSQHGLEWSR